MAYSWAGHIKSVARLFRADGSGWTKQLYAEDQFGRKLSNVSSVFAVKWSLIGAMYKIFYENMPWDRRWDADQKDIYMRQLNRRMEILLHLLNKAGLSLSSDRSVQTMCLIDFEQSAKWTDIKMLLQRAYKIAVEAE